MVVTSNVSENFDGQMLPQEVVVVLAVRKAQEVSKKVAKNAIIIAADTMVVLGTEVLGKPESVKEAKEMLQKLSGQRHEVFTGLAVTRLSDNKVFVDYGKTIVCFRKITDEEVSQYSATAEWKDKAGGYAIQGIAAKFVESIEGEYSNVVGLPLCKLMKIFNENF
jgi:septum formation protein